MKKIKELWENYWDWIFDLSPFIGAMVLIINIAIPLFTITAIMVNRLANYDSSICLDSQVARRWQAFICEEYHDGEWIKIDPNGNKIYHYNEPASREER